MIYNTFHDEELSSLGLGTMRLPTIDGDDSKVDVAAATEMVDYALKHGINYFDTAWGYHAGNSELVMGDILSRYPRESYYLATKFPGYDKSNFGKAEEIFEEQMKKLQTDYFDFYLFHNVCELNIEKYLDPTLAYDYLISQKKAGKIRHLGFSAHGDAQTIRRFLDAYGKDMEFCQIQLNWMDWDFQDAKEKVALLNEWNIPIWVMEPLRGGRLTKLPEDCESTLKSLRPNESITAWAFRYLQSIPGVTMVLSGMSTLDQLKDNISIFERHLPLNEEEMTALYTIGKKISGGVPCTACHYCVSHCPKGLDIPLFMSLYNESSYSGAGYAWFAAMRLAAEPKEKRPSACIGCRSCEKVCPQGIKIPDIIAQMVAKK